MLEYWIQSGEARLRDVEFNPEDAETIKDLIFPLFQSDGKMTLFTQKYFRHLNIKNKEDFMKKTITALASLKESKSKICFVCGKQGADKLKGWIFPFVITREKFPNISNEISICRECALKSFAAYTTAIFTTQGNYLNYIIFFADNADELYLFMKEVKSAVQEFIPEYYRNWKLTALIYYPFEFLAYITNDITIYMETKKEIFDINIGAIVVSVDVGGSKKIYKTSSVITNVNLIAKLLIKFRKTVKTARREKAERLLERGIEINPEIAKDPFRTMFSFMKKEMKVVANKVTPDLFVARNAFFKELYQYKNIDWKAVEEIVFYRAKENGTVPYLSQFLRTTMEVFNMSDKELYDKVSGLGYTLGSALLQKGERFERAKQYLFELRRKRNLEEFLDQINLIQVYAETPVDDRPFRNNEKLFYKLKVFFLIGMANAIFQNKPQKAPEEE